LESFALRIPVLHRRTVARPRNKARQAVLKLAAPPRARNVLATGRFSEHRNASGELVMGARRMNARKKQKRRAHKEKRQAQEENSGAKDNDRNSNQPARSPSR